MQSTASSWHRTKFALCVAMLLVLGMAQSNTSSESLTFGNMRRLGTERIENGTIAAVARKIVPGWTANTQVYVSLMDHGFECKSYNVSNGRDHYFLRWIYFTPKRKQDLESQDHLELKNRLKVAAAGLAPPVLGRNEDAFISHLYTNARNFDGWAYFSMQSKSEQRNLARTLGSMLARYHQIPIDDEERKRRAKILEKGNVAHNKITEVTLNLVPGAREILASHSRPFRTKSEAATRIVFSHNDFHPRNVLVTQNQDFFLVDNGASGPNVALYDLAKFFHVWTVFAWENGAFLPGIKGLDDLGRDNNPLFGHSNYPSLSIRRDIAAAYLQQWNMSDSKEDCDELLWAVEVDRNLEWNPNSCINHLGFLNEYIQNNTWLGAQKLHANNASEFDDVLKRSRDCVNDMKIRNQIIDAAVAGDELLYESIMEQGILRTLHLIRRGRELGATAATNV